MQLLPGTDHVGCSPLEGSLQAASGATLFDVWSPTNIDRILFLGWWLWQGLGCGGKLLDRVQVLPGAGI
jgi:hypothetical protein